MTALNAFLNSAQKSSDDMTRRAQAQQAAQEAKDKIKRERETAFMKDIDRSFGALIKALASLPPDKEGRIFKSKMHDYCGYDFTVEYLPEDRTVMWDPPMGHSYERPGFRIGQSSSQGENATTLFNVENMTRKDGIIYSARYHMSAEEAIGYIGEILPHIAKDRMAEITQAVTRAFTGQSLPAVPENAKEKPTTKAVPQFKLPKM